MGCSIYSDGNSNLWEVALLSNIEVLAVGLSFGAVLGVFSDLGPGPYRILAPHWCWGGGEAQKNSADS